ncbi:hypothetical protein G0Q06_08400 [Puniceicoccales bacterium CK1056]|uniref:Uncharacterized protein n=1 Tax=Oceanipulchritudo coccoides TaxID=2706888 RepID=A0A6B2M307_9BACT|nr:hypothetical protein [Oceanipulchritudo coccoides]NDV62467.1 hypothetical protein [Oceanipulchritudo coccoides]
MSKNLKSRRRSRSRRQKEPWIAKASILLLLVNGFIWAGLRSLDIVLLSFLSMAVAFGGWLFGRAAGKYIRRRHGSLGGESMAQIGYWGNLVAFIATFLLFSYSLAMGVLRGDFL